jgi:ABC-2 type transport system ATP-binding protein
MIHTEDLTKYFDEFLAVNRVNLDVPAGTVLVLLGPNGAGKTTTVRMLTSILKPSAGKAVVAGFNVVDHPDKVRASVGVLTEHHGLYGRMTANEYLEFFGRLYGLPDATSRLRQTEMLELFGLAEARKRRLGEYSKGMRQKLALVRALLHEPPVLLLDEPTSAMDPESAHMVREAIRTLRSKDRTILLCTHNLIEAEELADQVAIIQRGRIIIQGTTDELKRKLLGSREYEVQVVGTVDGNLPEWPEGITLTWKSADRLRFKVDNPTRDNPLLLQALMQKQYQVVTLQELPQSLEDTYLEAVRMNNGKEAQHV